MSEKFMLEVLDVFSDNRDLEWTVGSGWGNVHFYLNCSDLFFWGCSDAEEITLDNISIYKQAVIDLKEAYKYGGCFASELFCCRIREERPQGACYSNWDKKVWPLFNACGPEKETGFGNPYAPGEYKKPESDWNRAQRLEKEKKELKYQLLAVTAQKRPGQPV